MDWAPWDSYYDQATDESSCHVGHEWQRDSYFGYGLDVIEEDSSNEEACIHVLRLLIAKADTEIVELKEELVILRSQLAWLDEDWSKLCSIALKEKIDCLDISIRGLKTKNIQADHDFGDHLQMLREPAEKIHDILQALLRNCFQQEDNQSIDVTAKESSSDHPVHSTDVLVEMKQSSDAASNTIGSEEAKETNTTAAEKHATSMTFSKPLGKTSKSLGTAKSVGVIANHSNLDISGADATHIKTNKRLIKYDSRISEKTEDNNPTLTPKVNCLPSSETQVENRSNLETVIFQTEDSSLKSTPVASKEAIADANEKLEQRKGLKVDLHKIGTSNSSSKKEKKRIVPFLTTEELEFSRADTEHTAVPSDLLLELLKQGKENKSEPKKKRTPRQKAEVAGTDNNSSSDLSVKLSQLKRKHQCNIKSFREQCQTDELGLTKFSKAKYKRRWNSKMSGENFRLSPSANEKIEKKKAHEEYVTTDVDMKLVSVMHKRRKVRLSSPVLEGTKVLKCGMINPTKLSDGARKVHSISPVFEGIKELRSLEINLVKMHRDSMDGTTRKDLRITECPGDSDNENLKSLSCSTEPHPKPSISDLNSLTVKKLKQIARQYKMKGCYKLRKEELAKEVGLYIMEGRRSQKKGGSIAASSRG